MKVTFFDVEYSNMRNKSICQIGILSRELGNPNSKVEQQNIFVNPEDTFDENCVRIHGITAETVANAPTLKEVWSIIEKYFTNAVLIGHNIASADLDALNKNLIRYNIEVPEMYYICTYQLAKQLVPSFAVRDYSLSTLCNFFNITTSKKHNAFHDACACSNLLDKLAANPRVDIESEIQRFVPEETEDFISYISGAALKKDINSLYGMIKGFSLDSKISESEKNYIISWRDSFAKYSNYGDIAKIIKVMDDILADGVITIDEITTLQITIRQHLDIVSTSTITLATQILNGIINGIITDEKITADECENLRQWLYENNYLSGHFPFDKLFSKIENVLWDETLTEDEAESIQEEINGLLHPVETLKNDLTSLEGKKVYLSGNFAFGQKSAVEQYIIEQGGIIDDNIDSDTDILLVGDYEQATENGFNKEITKAISFKESGGKIQISKESDVIKPEKSFSDVLFDFIDASGMSDSEVYNKVGLPRQMMSKIRNQHKTGYHPTKSNICSFAIALNLSLDDTKKLLYSAGYTLSRSLDFDRVIEEFIQRSIYDIDIINEKLYELGLKCLGER